MKDHLNLVIPVLLAFFAGIGWLYKHEREKRLQIERQLSEKKYLVYSKFIDLYYKIYENVKNKKTMTDQESFKIMIQIKKELIIYGSDAVVLKFFKWEELSSQGNRSLIPITDIIIAIRKDMVSPKTKITSKIFLKNVVRNVDEYNQLHEKGVV